MGVRKAVIPAAGLGTRFLPATKEVPKELLPIVDRPTIQYVVEEAVSAGVDQVIFILSKGKEAVADHFDLSNDLIAELEAKGKTALAKELRELASLVQVLSIRQKKPLGLGHAIGCARSVVGDEPCVVLLGDDIVDAEVPCARQMAEVYEKTGKGVVAVMEVAPHEVELYGVVDGEEIGERMVRVTRIVEKPKAGTVSSRLAVIGRYLLPPSIFPIIERTKPGVGGEIQITDALAELAKTEGLIAYRFQGLRFDAGDRLGYLQANLHYALRRPELAVRLRAHLQRLVGACGT